MKIHEIVSEGKIEPNFLFTLRNIVKNGKKTTNVFELVSVARAMELLRAGRLHTEGNPLFSSATAPTKELLDLLRAMSDEDFVEVAKKLEVTMTAHDQSYQHLCCPTMGYQEWIKLFTAREAND